MSEREQSIHPDLKVAYEKNLPEAYLPPEVFAALKGQALMFDEYSFLGYGFRASPTAIRTLCIATCNGFVDKRDFHSPFSPQFRLNAAVYALFNDLISKPEFSALSKGEAIEGNLVQEPEELFISPNHHTLGNKVFGCVEAVALDIEKRRVSHPNLKVVLFHGKWNTIPHPGHMFCLRDTIQEMELEYGVNPQDLVFVILCDTNQEIAATGQIPFLNTFWRTSMMSYWPYVDYACPSGDFPLADQNAADRHWLHKYAILRPFAVNVAPDHSQKKIVLERIAKVGAIPVESHRLSQWYPAIPGEFVAQEFGEQTASSRELKWGKIDETQFERAFRHMLFLKNLRDQMYGRRRWFNPKGIVLPDPVRGLSLETIRPIINRPPVELSLQLSSHRVQPIQKAKIPSVTDLISERQHQILIDILSREIP